MVLVGGTDMSVHGKCSSTENSNFPFFFTGGDDKFWIYYCESGSRTSHLINSSKFKIQKELIHELNFES